MARAGKPKRVEVMERIADAAASRADADREAEQQAAAEREARALNLWGHCRKAVLDEPALWPGDEIGLQIAEAMMMAAESAARELVRKVMAERGVALPEAIRMIGGS
jgi:hypothetical protein